MIKLLFFILTLLIAKSDISNPYIEKIKAYNQSIQQRKRPEGRQVHFFDYSTYFEYWDQDMPPQHVRTKLYVGAYDLHYFSNFMDIFVDKDYAVTILKGQKQIVLTRSVQEFDPYYMMSKMAKISNK